MITKIGFRACSHVDKGVKLKSANVSICTAEVSLNILSNVVNDLLIYHLQLVDDVAQNWEFGKSDFRGGVNRTTSLTL